MFKKRLTVSGICAEFTGKLEAVKTAQEAEVRKQEAIIEAAEEAHQAASTEAEAASKAIKNIKELFGV